MGAKKTTPQKKKASGATIKPSVTRSIGSFWERHKRLRAWLIGAMSVFLLLALGTYVAFRVSPWPGSLLIRYEFNRGGAKMAEGMKAHVPTGVTAIENQPYQPDNKDGYLDVFYPDGTSKPLPAIVWVHGGGWVSGDKNDVDNYLKILAARGYTTIGVDYTIAPEAKYPGPILQLNDALDYLQQHADRLHIDTNQMVLAGDSAGSQIIAQMANAITSPAYASELAIRPALAADKLAGVLLNCGAYDLALPDYSGPFGSFLHTVLWAYSGTKDFLHDPKLAHASVVNYVTKDFPPAFITAGNVDPLLPQSIEFASKLQRLGVPVSTLFYPKEYTPELNHEYQFNLDTDGGKRALTQMTEFLKTYTD
jgi:acetyl esterase